MVALNTTFQDIVSARDGSKWGAVNVLLDITFGADETVSVIPLICDTLDGTYRQVVIPQWDDTSKTLILYPHVQVATKTLHGATAKVNILCYLPATPFYKFQAKSNGTAAVVTATVIEGHAA